MIKQWKNENLGVTYFYLPNSKNNEILTSDGVLIPYDEFKSMTSETYNAKKNTNGGYDYMLSKQSERLVKKALNVKKESAPTSSSTQTVKPTVVSTSTPIKRVKNPIQLTEKGKGFIKSEKKKDTETVAESKKVEVEEKPNAEKKQKFNLFDFIYPKLILIIVIMCSCLSISFTKTYMLRLQSLPIAYAMSSSILIYGIIGMQMARRAKKAKKYLQSFMFGITSISVIGFSMFSAVDVNFAKFKESHQVIEKAYNANDGKKLSFDLYKEELADNKKQIENLSKDIEFQQTQWVLAWDNELKKNVLLEGRISSTAQDKITDDKNRIEELTNRNKEINEKLREYAESGASVEKVESDTERAKSLTDLIGAMLGVSGNIVQLIILLIPSIFTDLINLLGTTIYVESFENKREKD